jgi:WD40 repeat protein
MILKLSLTATCILIIASLWGCTGMQSTPSLQNTFTPIAKKNNTPQGTIAKSLPPLMITESPTLTLAPTEISIKLPSSIAFMAYEKTARIGILDKDLNKNQLVEGCWWCNSISWSPDGNWIAFPSSFADGNSIQIYIVNTKSKEIKKITTGPKAKADVTWSPDGKYLFYIED